MQIALTSDLHGGYSTKTYKIHERWLEDLEEKSFDILILAGDLGTTKLKDFERILKHIRTKVAKPILAVRGNHDLWDKSKYDLEGLMKEQEQIFKDLDIHHCEQGPYVVGNIGFYGWDGWYNLEHRYQNDWNFMPQYTGGRHTHDWLSKRTYSQFMRVYDELQIANTTTNIVITHMPCFRQIRIEDEIFGANPKYYEMLRAKDNIDYICYGHTHLAEDEVYDGIRFLNSGSDYDSPVTLFFEVEDEANNDK